MKPFLSVALVLMIYALYGQCPDGPAKRYLELSNSHPEGAQAYSQAGIYEAYLCKCLDGVTPEQAHKLKTMAMYSKKAANEYKPTGVNLKFRPWPTACKEKPQATSSSSERANIYNTSFFGDKQLAQLQKLAAESEDEDFKYMVNEMADLRETGKLARQLSDENHDFTYFTENVGQIGNLLFAGVKRKLEEEAAKQRSYEDAYLKASSDIANLHHQIELQFYSSFMKKKFEYLSHLYLNEPSFNHNLLELYNFHPILEYPELVSNMYALKKHKDQLETNIAYHTHGQNLASMGISLDNVIEDFKDFPYAQNYKSLNGDSKSMMYVDQILQLKHVENPVSNDLIFKTLNRVTKPLQENAKKEYFRKDLELDREYIPIQAAIFAVSEEFLPDVKRFLEEYYSWREFNSDFGSNDLRSATIYAENTLLKTSFLLRRGENAQAIDVIESCLDEVLFKLDMQKFKKLDRHFGQVKDEYFGVNLAPEKALMFYQILSELSLNLIDAYLKANRPNEATAVFSKYGPIYEFLLEEENSARLSLLNSLSLMSDKPSKKKMGDYFKGQGSYDVYIQLFKDQFTVPIEFRYYLYSKVLLNQNINLDNKLMKASLFYEWDRTHKSTNQLESLLSK